MSVETATYINQLDPNLPSATDVVNEADDHFRLIKRILKATFPNLTGPVTSTADQLNTPIPAGLISMWSGAVNAIPVGWALCNGQVVGRSDGSGSITTPDLRDRFIFGAGVTAPGTTGGSSTIIVATSLGGGHTHSASTDAQGAHSHGGNTGGHVLSISEMPPHNHGFTAALQQGGYGSGLYSPSPAIINNVGLTTGASGDGAAHSHPIPLDGTHGHNVSVAPAGDHSHTISIGDSRPPFYTLAMIIKV